MGGRGYGNGSSRHKKNCTKEEVGQDYGRWDEYLRKLLFVDVLYVMERNNSNE